LVLRLLSTSTKLREEEVKVMDANREHYVSARFLF
jgi:hypothetical protein